MLVLPEKRLWFEGRWGSREVALVVEYAHPEWRLTPLSFCFTSRACCAFRNVGKSRTAEVAHPRGALFKEVSIQLHRQREATRDWVR